MTTRYTYLIELERKDTSTEDLGRIIVEGETYGEPNETGVLTEALQELTAVGSFYQFRNALFLKTEMKTLRVTLLQMEDVGAGG
ncbi:hypothetical protein [Deinococcus sp. QL22]|uniref:hypothetical protein n=1 Tax=Deinococcus sp. QL22 TaxID=2939437 RepID=UPI00201755D2|nr:hypothetical protein [Deinococcus sp. QL22]UQN06752.1 hypothetical protein M1R55_02185 [Deinococcus sp. QL22]